MSDYFEALKKHTLHKASPGFDRKFWNEFSKEFKAAKRAPFWNWKLWVPAFAAAASFVIALAVLRQDKDAVVATHAAEVMAVVAHQDLLSQLELLKTMDTVFEGMQVSDEDWAILLPEGVPNS